MTATASQRSRTAQRLHSWMWGFFTLLFVVLSAAAVGRMEANMALVAAPPGTAEYLYTGEQIDPDLGMYYLRARYYQPATGRFWTMDSFEGRQEEPLGLHKYLYCNADPINSIDPTGHESLKSKLGKEVHLELGKRFKNSAPTRHSGPAIATIAREYLGPLASRVDTLFPDLLDWNLREIYEIKPMTGYGLATGFFQAMGYVSVLNSLDPRGGWHLGSTWTPPNFLILQSGVAYVSPPVGGIIFYEATTIQDIAKKGARSVGRSSQTRIEQSMGMATMLSSMGGF